MHSYANCICGIFPHAWLFLALQRNIRLRCYKSRTSKCFRVFIPKLIPPLFPSHDYVNSFERSYLSQTQISRILVLFYRRVCALAIHPELELFIIYIANGKAFQIFTSTIAFLYTSAFYHGDTVIYVGATISDLLT